MNNISINSQPQTPHEEAKMIKLDSSTDQYLAIDTITSPKAVPTTLGTVNPTAKPGKF